MNTFTILLVFKKLARRKFSSTSYLPNQTSISSKHLVRKRHFLPGNLALSPKYKLYLYHLIWFENRFNTHPKFDLFSLTTALFYPPRPLASRLDIPYQPKTFPNFLLKFGDTFILIAAIKPHHRLFYPILYWQYPLLSPPHHRHILSGFSQTIQQSIHTFWFSPEIGSGHYMSHFFGNVYHHFSIRDLKRIYYLYTRPFTFFWLNFWWRIFSLIPALYNSWPQYLANLPSNINH
jgi:hypothetical protein